jgi:hypothetical protein
MTGSIDYSLIQIRELFTIKKELTIALYSISRIQKLRIKFRFPSIILLKLEVIELDKGIKF